ncbi:MAG TPA: efflux RND transporter periplasmic adaptor subunit [Thermoanaerobaculia bacterium]|nr:efflux RND transporter periplasmic adaptor subunit [Thermoanaerobaculia bacterium]
MKKHLSLLFVFAALACTRERNLQPAPMPVRVEVLKRADFTPSLTLLGTIRSAQTIPLTATQRGTLVLAPRFARGLRTGEAVVKGERIAEVRNDQIVSARTQARLQLEAAIADHDRTERSYKDGVVSSADYSASKLRVQLARENYDAMGHEVAHLFITAPASGTLVVERAFASGAAIDAGTVLAEIATGGAPVVESAVAASDRALLHPGLPVRLRGPGGWTGGGKIAEVASVIGAEGTARVVIDVDGNVTPAPGVGVEGDVELDRRVDVLTIPEEAIVAGEDGPAVFVVALAEGIESGLRVKRVAIETGGRAAGRTEVKSGVRDGDRVVITGADALVDDARVLETKAEAKP